MDGEAILKNGVHTVEESPKSKGLDIDTEMHRKDTDIHSSLESIFGYRVFSDAFSEKLQTVTEHEKDTFYQGYNDVFTHEYVDNTEQNYMCVMESKQPLVIREDYYQNREDVKIGSFLYFLCGMILALVFIVGIGKMKGKGRR